MVWVLGRAKMWTALLFAGFVALLATGGEDKKGFVEALHQGMRILCLVFALGVVVACAANAVRRRDLGNRVIVVLAALGTMAMVAGAVIALGQEPGSADFGSGELLLGGLVLTVIAGLVTRD